MSSPEPAEHRRAMQRRHRPAHARRTAAQFADFLLPHLRPGMRLLDIGTGPGSIAAGLADVVGQGLVTGVDLWPMADARVTMTGADAVLLPSPTSTQEEMGAIADAWRAWATDPRSFSASAWFRALAWA